MARRFEASSEPGHALSIARPGICPLQYGEMTMPFGQKHTGGMSGGGEPILIDEDMVHVWIAGAINDAWDTSIAEPLLHGVRAQIENPQVGTASANQVLQSRFRVCAETAVIGFHMKFHPGRSQMVR